MEKQPKREVLSLKIMPKQVQNNFETGKQKCPSQMSVEAQICEKFSTFNGIYQRFELKIIPKVDLFGPNQLGNWSFA